MALGRRPSLALQPYSTIASPLPTKAFCILFCPRKGPKNYYNSREVAHF